VSGWGYVRCVWIGCGEFKGLAGGGSGVMCRLGTEDEVSLGEVCVEMRRLWLDGKGLQSLLNFSTALIASYITLAFRKD
jgi:hypothetical protein